MRLFPVVLAALLLAGLASPVRAASSPAYALILDATAGLPRLESAKPALNAVVRDLPANAQVALYLYPRPSSEACFPVRELVPLGPLDRQGLLRAIAGMSTPDGRPPQALDLAAATKRILEVRTPVTAVLLSTGLDTCGEDPGQTVALLKTLGVPFVLRIVGYQVTPMQAATLRSMADLSGGTYESAANGGDLANALRKAFQVSNLMVRATRRGLPLDAVVEVRRAGTEALLVSQRTGPSGVGAFTLPDGSYDLAILDQAGQGSGRFGFQAVTVAYGRIAVREADLGGAEARVAVSRGGKTLDAPLEIAAENGSGFLIQGRSGSPPAALSLPPGIYTLRVRDPENPQRPPLILTSQAVRPGTVTSIPVCFDEGRVSVRASRHGLPVDARVEVFAAERKEPLAAGMSGAETPTPYALSPGSYTVVVTDLPSRKTVTLKNVSVSPGQTASLDAVID